MTSSRNHWMRVEIRDFNSRMTEPVIIRVGDSVTVHDNAGPVIELQYTEDGDHVPRLVVTLLRNDTPQ